MKKLICKLVTVIVVLIMLAVPFLGQLTCNVYATGLLPDVSPNTTSPASEQDVVDAFIAYCKSRDLTIEGSVLDVVTSFTTSTYNAICKSIGINPTTLQAEISKVYDNQGVFSHWAFTALGINGFNRIFAQLLQDNELQVGDSNVDINVFNGKSYNGYLIWEGYSSFTITNNDWQRITKKGTYYKYNSNYMSQLSSGDVLSFAEFNYSFNVSAISNGSFSGGYSSINGYCFSSFFDVFNGSYVYGGNTYNLSGYPILYYHTGEQKLYLALYTFDSDPTYRRNVITQLSYPLTIPSNEIPDTTVDIKTIDDEPIKEPYPDDEPVDIYPDGGNEPGGDDNPTPPGGSDPGWTIPDSNVEPDGDGGFNIDWNFNLPDLNIDWSINGLSEKFPFSIPFDLYNLVTVLDAEPSAPRFQGNVTLLTYTWALDLDFSRFDSIASIMRNVMLVSYIFGLIIATRSIIKG